MMMASPFVWCMFCDQVALLIVIILIYQPLLKTLAFDLDLDAAESHGGRHDAANRLHHVRG
jgi:hypothetical protein